MVTSALAVVLSQVQAFNLRRWACIFGLLGQPFWFIETYQAHQTGMFVMCFIYTGAWFLGVYNGWVKPALTIPKPKLSTQEEFTRAIARAERARFDALFLNIANEFINPTDKASVPLETGYVAVKQSQ